MKRLLLINDSNGTDRGKVYAGIRAPTYGGISVKWHDVKEESRDVILVHPVDLAATQKTLNQFAPNVKVAIVEINLPVVL